VRYFLCKPYTTMALLSAIEAALAGRPAKPAA
jgi:hypothetical protein